MCSSVGVAVCSLNQLSLDFETNSEHILRSIHESIERGALIRVGPELEICGYGCEDAFFEADTCLHSWQVVAKIIQQDFKNIIIDLGLPVLKDSNLYNCRVVLLNSKIIFIRPKLKLANEGNYRESRWFTPWGSGSGYEESVVWYQLPPFITTLTGQQFVPFGADVVLDLCLQSTTNQLANLTPLRIGFEICEELWTAESSHVKLFHERGCHLVCNSSGSYWEIRKLDRAVKLMQSTTSKFGGMYAFSNLLGCDGGRLCFYGRSMILRNGKIVSMTTLRENIFSDVQVAVNSVNIYDVTSFRQQFNLKGRPHRTKGPTLVFDAKCGYENNGIDLKVMEKVVINVKGIQLNNSKILERNEMFSSTLQMLQIKPEEEILLYGSLWLWDYLKRTSMKGFIIPLSGGIDSSSVAILIHCMCILLWEQRSSVDVAKILNKLCPIDSIKSANDICSQILRCCYLQTKYSGNESFERAKSLASSIGAEFLKINFQSVYDEVEKQATNESSKDSTVTLRQQNLQARLRMVLTYYMSEGNRLVLATGNVDEALVGYLTKYDCSSADLNPIGGISKCDLRAFVKYCKINFQDCTVIDEILNATPSAELTGAEQKDEDDIGLTYAEMCLFGKLRRGDLGCYGPYGLFCRLWEHISNETLCDKLPNIRSVDDLAWKVKRFYSLHSRNRHKQTILTPALHAETYSPDDNRFDHRQFLFNTNWTWQFKSIDEEVQRIKSKQLS
ncbi:putative glutamine-dependent NAD(+) synthetase-like protein [Leptotrombidium deliense]|uniref:Glutamine-dependent NAD(+) synthetase n=1 Tax=Leptotrombidium deliense TaxID=299467 RepID=A0A443SE09_9ACAR|nr:putative glutamine-dependent NAD(+) synthetase-like protein [Leptotrombidium deliense]